MIIEIEVQLSLKGGMTTKWVSIKKDKKIKTKKLKGKGMKKRSKGKKMDQERRLNADDDQMIVNIEVQLLVRPA